jgi:uncharacterized protein GlcG (DUF336 family)
MLEYYSQRASEGGLIVSEGTSISIAAGGWFGAPGLYSDEQVAGWKRITDAVHGKRGYMFSQLWHTGRATHVDSTNGATPVSSSVNPEYWQDSTIKDSTPHGWLQPSPHRALEIREIPGIVEDYRKAAERAKAAGFDGVELHAGNGYLADHCFNHLKQEAGSIFDRTTVHIGSRVDAILQKLVDRAMAKAKEIGVSENVAILDDGGNLKAFSRMDWAPILCIEMALNKAYTALFGVSTQDFFNFIQRDPSPLAGIPTLSRVAAWGGGFPIKVDGEIVGAIGLSGAPTVQNDTDCARAALALVSDAVPVG